MCCKAVTQDMGADFVWGDADQGGIVFDPSPKLLAAETFQVCVDEQGDVSVRVGGNGLISHAGVVQTI